MNLDTLRDELRAFVAARGWEPFHDPKNLSTALMVEAAELAEIFQWMTREQSLAVRTDAGLRERTADEVADVLIYLVELADNAGIDIGAAVANKLRKTALKYPAPGGA